MLYLQASANFIRCSYEFINERKYSEVSVFAVYRYNEVRFNLLAVLLFLFHLHWAISEDAQVRIFNLWPRGFYRRISIDLEDEVEDGWQVTVTFSKPVARLVAWNAKIDAVSDDKKVYVLKNRFWNAHLEAGGKLK